VATLERHEDAAARFERLFRAELPYVWGSLRRLGVEERDVEDLTHDVFVQVYKKLDVYDPARPLRPWLFAFAYRAASDYRRLARHRDVITDDVDAESRAPLAEDALSAHEDATMVRAALASIDLDRRAVLVAYELDEIPMKDIAASLEIPLHTAYSRLRVAREELAAAVQRLLFRRGER
jgi:RNA polymerase sigma-70 factor (ECF subfamily)